MDPLDVIARTGAAAFATDESGRIAIWNKGAEEMLGHSASQVLGKPCHEVLCGHDVFGNRFCYHGCALTCMVGHNEAAHHFELDVLTESGQSVPVSFSIVVVPGARPPQYTLIHFLDRIDRQRDAAELIRRILAENHALRTPDPTGGRPAVSPSLTAREIQVLHMLAEGTSTQGIADSLLISVPTTRNHIQSILRKLDAHSKLEAVSLAMRANLL